MGDCLGSSIHYMSNSHGSPNARAGVQVSSASRIEPRQLEPKDTRDDDSGGRWFARRRERVDEAVLTPEVHVPAPDFHLHLFELLEALG